MKKISILFLLFLVIFSSCEEFVEEQPVDIITDDQVIIDAASAEAAILGTYSRIQTGGAYGGALILYPGVLSDELIHSGSFPTIAEMDQNNVTSNNVTMDDFWRQGYTAIFQANNILELLGEGAEFPGLTTTVQNRIVAEARFLRALMHFHMTNHWGAVPLATTTDLATLSNLERTPANEVYAFVIAEAAAAAAALAAEDPFPAGDRQFRATEWAAKALQARALLYDGQVSQAGAIANDIIENGPYELAADYENLFGPGPVKNEEIIFSIFYSALDQNGIPFQFLPAGRFEYAVGPNLVEAFEGDERALIEVNSADPAGRSYVTKYQDINTGTDGVIVFRLAEMYLIRAEANMGTQQAVDDINLLRERAGLDPVTSVDIDVILSERFTELSFEGHRWFDLRRLDVINEVMPNAANSDWDPTDALLPVPQRDIEQNPNLLPQNPGYGG